MPGNAPPNDVKIRVYVEPLSTPAAQAFKDAREDDDDTDTTWESVTEVTVLEGEPAPDLGEATRRAKDKAEAELLFGGSVAVAVPAVLEDFGEAWVFLWFGWE